VGAFSQGNFLQKIQKKIMKILEKNCKKSQNHKIEEKKNQADLNI
jgi:hypothetical protein